VHRGVGSLVMEQGVARLRHAREEDRVGVEPGLKRRAGGNRKVHERRASDAAWAEMYTRRREPPEPRIAGAEWSAAWTRARRNGEGEREMEKSTGAMCGCGVGLMVVVVPAGVTVGWGWRLRRFRELTR
jgi:hypothetical protein